MAKACLQERIPYWGLALSELHCRKTEVVLTDFILSEMRREGSSHYRPECVLEPGTDGATDGNGTVPKAKPQPKKKPKTRNTDQADTADTTAVEGEGQEPAPKKPRKTKKDKKEDEDDEKSDASSLPW